MRWILKHYGTSTFAPAFTAFADKMLRRAAVVLLAMLAENDLWAPRIMRAQKAVLDKLPQEAIAFLSGLCHEELNRTEGRAALAKLGQRMRESPALEQNRDAYTQATTKDSQNATWQWLTAAILVKVNEHHAYTGQLYLQISENYLSEAAKRHQT